MEDSHLIPVILAIMAGSHLAFWFSGNTQFLVGSSRLALFVCVVAGVIGTLLSSFSSKIGFGKFSMWELRMLGFAASYFTFPLLTWWFFHESALNPKTLVSIGISVILICVQIFWK